MNSEAIREAFFAWKRAEGRPDEVIPSLHEEYYGNLFDRPRSEDIMIDTWIHPGYKEWVVKADYAMNEVISSYHQQGTKWFSRSQKSTPEDSLGRASEMGKVMTFGSYFQHLIPSVKTSYISVQLAQSGKYLESMILLRSAFEGTLKAGLKAWRTISDGDFYNTEKIDGGYQQTFGLKTPDDLDRMGLSALCREAESSGLTGVLKSLYKEMDLHELNKFVHHNEGAGDEIGWNSLITIRSYDSDNWSAFSKHHGNLTELALILTHNIARTQDWIDMKELNLDVLKISKSFPRLAETMVEDGMIEDCISCGKPRPVKLTERRGRCWKCFKRISGQS
jgi:hypothetical protein